MDGLSTTKMSHSLVFRSLVSVAHLQGVQHKQSTLIAAFLHSD